MSLPTYKPMEIWQLASLFQMESVTVFEVVSFVGKANVHANGHIQLHFVLCYQQDMLDVCCSVAQLFCTFLSVVISVVACKFICRFLMRLSLQLLGHVTGGIYITQTLKISANLSALSYI